MAAFAHMQGVHFKRYEAQALTQMFLLMDVVASEGQSKANPLRDISSSTPLGKGSRAGQ